MPASRLNIDEVRKRLDGAQRTIYVLLANQAQNYFVDSFKKQGFANQPWKEVQRRMPDKAAYKYPKKKGLQRRTSPILIGSGYKIRGGTLRRAVSNMSRTAQYRTNGFRMIVDLPYAAIHNEGGTINKKEGARASYKKVKVKGQGNLKQNKKGQYRMIYSTRTIEIRGEDIKVGAHDIHMPKRQFVGQTMELERMQEDLIRRELNKIFKQ